MKAACPIALVTENNVQASTFAAYLISHLSRPVQLIHEINQLDNQCDGTLFLIDLDYIRSGQSLGWNRAISERFGMATTVLLNAPTATDRDLLLMWPQICGLFFRQDPLDRLVAGLQKILLGEYWMPRQLLCELVEYYRQGNSYLLRNDTLLTAREQEIIRYLMTGASNVEIADSLFVSEHTVKSHLYNVFKKLNVKNRIQAVSWAKEYLDAPDSH
ncbi:LuxR C-terminal-related transcriptional regulator [Aeromonas veronii]|uniref:LuxR C-terminal-related transcriptional regulator n=1 Tax=Aeromonas veronii TaxID=654 RepID=UPI00191F4849|nr:LuxR C-terminal-related transcriptional regulator [Aeromonas veronii]MBL0594723.1 helix-turn-helix transcriptional regulator [Aeromonas veronii]